MSLLARLRPVSASSLRSLSSAPLAAHSFSTSTLKLFSTTCTPFDAPKIDNLTVFGAGLMGAGIAQVAAMNGVKVVMTDVSEGALENG